MSDFTENGKNLIRTTRLADQDVKAILANISDKTAANGVVALLNEEYPFHSYERALEVLSTSQKKENDLLIAEAALQTTINEIKEFNQRNPKYWSDQKTSLYLYTLQYIILHLSAFEKSIDKNNYKPRLVAKIHEISARCARLGLDIEIMRSQCLTTQYQQADNSVLRDFKFIDLERVESFSRRLKKYEITHKINDLYESNLYQQLPTTSQIDAIIQKLITHMEKKFSIKLDLQSYEKNCGPIINEINNLFTTADPGVVQYISEALKKNLEAKEQIKGNDDHII